MKQISQTFKRFSFLNFARLIISFSIIAASLQLSTTENYGQSQTDFTGIDTTFTPRLEFAGNVSRMILQPDGKRILIGSFSKANGLERRDVVRVNPDNSIDTSFNLPESVSANNLELLPGGKFITSANQAGLVRLNSDGSIDSSFNFGRTIAINEIKFKPRGDGKVFAFGKFKVKKQSRVVAEDFMLLDELGGIESGFKIDYTGTIANVIPLPSGKTIIYGSFEVGRFGQTVGRNFAVLDENGLPNAAFDIFFGAQAESVYGVNIQPDGKLLVHGDFSQAIKQTGLNRFISKNKGILRLNADGSLDRNFSVPFAAASIYQTLIQPDGKIILYAVISGSSYKFISRIFADGSPDVSFNGNVPLTSPSDYYHRVTEMKLQADGKILLAGTMKVSGRPDIQLLIRLASDGSLDGAYRPLILGGAVAGIENQPDGKILIWGGFGRISNQTHIGLARLSANGVPEQKFRFDVLLNNPGRVKAIALQTDGKYIVGGAFSVVNGEYIYNFDTIFSPAETNFPFGSVVRLNQDGSLDNSFAPQTNTFDEVLAVAVQADGKILVGGQIRSWLNPNTIYRLNPDGTKDPTFNRLPIAPFESSRVSQIIAQPDGKILLGGFFNRVGNANRTFLARLKGDGTLDDLVYNHYFDGLGVNRIILQPDGKILVGGIYLGSGTTIPGLPRFNPDSTMDANFRWNQTPTPAFTRDIQLQADGKIWFSGRIGFPEYENYYPYGLYRMNQNGEIEAQFNLNVEKILPQADGKIIIGAFNRFSRLFPDGSVDNSFDFAFDRQVYQLVQQTDGKILVAGEFATVNGISQASLVRLNP